MDVVDKKQITTTPAGKANLKKLSKLRKKRGVSNKFEHQITEELIGKELKKELIRHAK